MPDYPAASAGLNIQPVAPINPMELAQQKLQYQTGQQQYQLGALKLQQAQQDMQDEQDVRRVAQQVGADPDKIGQVLMMQNPRAAQKFNQELAATRKSQAEADQIGLKNKDAVMDLMGRDASAVQDQDGWTRFLQNPTYRDHTQGLNPTFDPAQRDQVVQSTMSAKDQIEAHQKAAQALLDKAKTDEEAKKGNIAQQQADLNKRESDMSAAAHVMSQVTNQADHTQALRYLKAAGVDPNVINLYGSQYTPDIPAKAKGYLDVGQKQDDKDKLVAAFNARPDLTAKFGPGELGLAAMQRSQKQEDEKQLEQLRIAGDLQKFTAEKNATKSNAPEFSDPNFRQADVATVEKKRSSIDDNYAGIVNHEAEFSNAIQQARAGNTVAYKELSVLLTNYMNSLSSIKRANAAEFSRADASGSAAQKIQGWLGALASGKSLAPGVINDMESFGRGLASNAGAAKQMAIQNLDRTYHTRYAQAEGGGQAPAVAPKANPYR